MVDVLTVTKRLGFFDVALESILRQQTDIHWVIVDENILQREEHQNMIVFDDYVVMVTYLAAPPKVRRSNLIASLNKGLRFCQTDYVVFYQDFIVLQENCVNDLLEASITLDNALVSTVTKNPPGQRGDIRYTGMDIIRRAEPVEYETNVAIAPMEVMHKLGGIDEEYDDGYGCDNLNIADRAKMLGYDIYVDEGNRPQLLTHEKNTEIPVNSEYHYGVMRDIQDGRRPLRLDYL